MDISPAGLVYSVGPQIPLIIATFVLALFGYSNNAAVQDFFTELLVVCARPVLGTPIAIRKSQLQFGKTWRIWGNMWIAKYVVPAPEVHYRDRPGCLAVGDAVKGAIEHLGDHLGDFSLPELVDVEGEWTGSRSGSSILAGRPNVSEQQQYENMMKEVELDSPTILYFHGGAFCLLDPASVRFTTTALAKATRGRCFSVRYRLAPQNTFPSALMDAFVAYLALRSPPPGAFHKAVPASQIIMGGDSSGGGLATSLMLLLRTLDRMCITHIRFHGHDVSIGSTPAAGLALNSPWLDISRALPSVHRNARFDIVAPPSQDPALGGGTPNFPADSVWPTTPPRVETYCEANLVTHPLVCPLAAHKELWQGAPPVYVCLGWETSQDEIEVVMRRMYAAGVSVVFDGFVAMPHCFAIMPFNAAGRTAFANMAAFCRQAVSSSKVHRSDSGTWTDKYGSVRGVKLAELGIEAGPEEHGRKIELDDITVDRLLSLSKQWRVTMESSLRKEWAANKK